MNTLFALICGAGRKLVDTRWRRGTDEMIRYSQEQRTLHHSNTQQLRTIYFEYEVKRCEGWWFYYTGCERHDLARKPYLATLVAHMQLVAAQDA